jgi:hypothetical protein
VADVFEEVEEELRAARYTQFARKAWPYAAGAVVLALLITLGVWGFNKHQASEQAKASATYEQALQAAGAGDLDGADSKFAALAASAPAGYRTLALMQQAGIRVVKGKSDEAARLLDQAAKAAPDGVLADAARLKAAYLLMDSRPLAEILSRLEPLVDDKRPFHLQAREARAAAQIQGGKPQDAMTDLNVLTLSPDGSDAMHQWAQQTKLLIQSGSAADLPVAAKAAPIAPPPIQAPASIPANLGAAQ